MYRYLVSFHSCSLWYWLKTIIVLYFSSVHTQLSVYRAKRCDSISVIKWSWVASWTGDRTFKCIPGMHHYITRNLPELVSATCRQVILRLHSVRYCRTWMREWVGLRKMMRLHRLSITGIYARIGLGLGLSRACNKKSDWLIRGRWFPWIQLNERPTPLRLLSG